MRSARPSARAVFPTPVSPTKIGIVLAPTREDVDRAVELLAAADQGIELALGGALGQVRREGRQRIGGHTLLVVAPEDRRASAPRAGRLGAAELRLAVADVSQQIQARDALRPQQRHRVGVGLLEDRGEQIADLDLVLLGARGVVHRVLQDAVEREGLERVDRVVARHALEVLFEELLELDAQALHVGPRMAQDAGAVLVVQQGVEQMLDGQVGVSAHDGLAVGRLERQLEVATDRAHSFSTPERRGYPRSSAIRSTVADFVSATSST